MGIAKLIARQQIPIHNLHLDQRLNVFATLDSPKELMDFVTVVVLIQTQNHPKQM